MIGELLVLALHRFREHRLRTQKPGLRGHRLVGVLAVLGDRLVVRALRDHSLLLFDPDLVEVLDRLTEPERRALSRDGRLGQRHAVLLDGVRFAAQS